MRFGASVERTSPFGSVSPSSLRLAPGASATVRVSAVVPAGAGDSSGAVTFDTGPAGGGPVSVPVTLRGLVAAGTGPGGTFSGVLTGGNGRSPGEGQVASYSFVVPSDLPLMLRDVEADVVLRNDPENQVSAYLVAPGGQTMGYGSNFLTTGFTSSRRAGGVAPAAAVAVHVRPDPRRVDADHRLHLAGPRQRAGRPVHRADPVQLGPVEPGQAARPAPGRSSRRGGRTATRSRLDNTGAAAEDVFLDARLTAAGQLRSAAAGQGQRGQPAAGGQRPTRRSGSCRR